MFVDVLYIGSWLLFVIASNIVIAIAISLPLLFAIAFKIYNVHFYIRVITIHKAIEKRSHESMCKTDTKSKQTGSRAKKFIIAKLKGR